VDRWVRNQFAENQLTDIDWIKRVSQASKNDPVGEFGTADQAAERSLGSFAGWAAANDWEFQKKADELGGVSIMHCCTGNAARSIYYVWEHILDSRNGKLRLNLLMNRASEWADVYSYVPYEGKVDLKIKKSFRNVLVRMPEWVNGDCGMRISDCGLGSRVECTVNGQTRDLKWEGRYVDLGSAKAGDRVTVSFPIYEWKTREKIGGKKYNLVLKGNTVVSVDPPGVNCPTYQRDKYRKNKAEWKTVKRFVSSEHLEW
jgi:hypothetical protein